MYHYESWAGKAETVSVSLTWLFKFKKRLSGFRPPAMFVIRISLQSSGGRTWRKSQAAPGSQSQSSQKYPATLGWTSQVLPIVRQDDADSKDIQMVPVAIPSSQRYKSTPRKSTPSRLQMPLEVEKKIENRLKHCWFDGVPQCSRLGEWKLDWLTMAIEAIDMFIWF